jgi:hypothetical protein
MGTTLHTLLGGSFIVNGAAAARDSALTAVSVEVCNSFWLAGTFETG